MDKQSFYLGALLHDIGKFIERAKDPQRIEKAKEWVYEGLTDWNYAHRRYGADFIKDNIARKSFFNENVNKLVLFHHRGNDEKKSDKHWLDQNVYERLLRIADDLASSERQEDTVLETVDYYRGKLISIFSQIRLKDRNQPQYKYLELRPLSLNELDIFPDQDKKHKPETDENEYPDLVNDFLKEFELVQNPTQLYYLLEKYLWAIPAQNPVEINGKLHLYRPDISLFDHSRATTAVAMCLYDEYQQGNIKDKDVFNDLKEYIRPLALLLHGDLSGIQSFIFNVQSKKAAKNLKGRSFYLQLLSEVVARYILDKFVLPEANMLYNGGGNFYLLIPKCRENEIQQLQATITQKLAKLHKGDIYFALGKIDITSIDIKENFWQKWDEVAKITNQIKTNRFSEVGYRIHDNNSTIFEPFGPVEDESFELLTKKISHAKALSIKKIKKIIEKKDPQNILKNFEEFGYRIWFHEDLDDSKINTVESYILNSTEFLPNFCGFKFAVLNLPQIEEKEGKVPITFEDLASRSSGDKRKLALLKMDVDNLGKIFHHGLPKEDRTISRMAMLSRMFRLFFEGYLDTLRKKYADQVYLVYTGGDDTFLIGSWNVVFDLADQIYSAFKKFTCENEDINLSAALTVIHQKFPMIRAAYAAEKDLSKAKSYCWWGEKEPLKNKISILGQVFSWKEFEYIKTFKQILVELLKHEDKNKQESRVLLQKVYNSTKGFSNLIRECQQGKMHVKKYWRFAYYLRNMRATNTKEKMRLVKIYEDLIKYTFFEKKENKVYNPMIIPVATRWAEWETKEK